MFHLFTSRFSMAEPGFDLEKICLALHGHKSTHVSAQLGEGTTSKCLIHRLNTFLRHLVKLLGELTLYGSGNGQTRLTMDGSEGECPQRAAFPLAVE